MKVHQPNMPAPEFEHKSLSKSKYADSVVENDTRIGRIMDKVRDARPRQEHAMSSGPRTMALGRMSILTQATRPSAAPRVLCARAATAFPPLPGGPGSRPGRRTHDIVGGLDYMATFAALAAMKLPEKDREGKPIIFDSYDMSPMLFGTGKSRAQDMVLLYRERADTRCGARRQLQGRLQSPRRRRRIDRRVGGGLQPRLEGRRKVCGDGAASLRPLAGPAGALRHLHEQLHRADLGPGDCQCDDQGSDEDLREVSTSEAAERELQRSHYFDPIRALSVPPRLLENKGINLPLPTGN